MSDRTEELGAPGDGKLYDAQGQVIRGTSSHSAPGSGQLTDFIREQPLTAAVFIFAMGYLAGKII